MVGQLGTHYFRVREELLSNYDKLRSEGASAEYLDKMAAGLQSWVDAADAGNLAGASSSSASRTDRRADEHGRRGKPRFPLATYWWGMCAATAKIITSPSSTIRIE
ncbi:hypothetical protein [Breoghania sp.]|uniref:hypothetical protein n=1 Tax=Breoghania sp. TaxID=2065378 RepID=UPI002634148D|nr:hypothetical protein [Breoghania sp.]MDJ0931499.1 hypothetical protein [Breoghania sp.]